MLLPVAVSHQQETSYSLLRQTCHDEWRLFHLRISYSSENANPLTRGLNQNKSDHDDEHGGHGSVQTIIKNQASRRTACGSGRQRLRLRQKPDTRVGIENLVPGCCKRDGNQLHKRYEGYCGIAGMVHLDDDGRGNAQSNGSEQLIGNAEQRPQRVDATQWVLYPLP